MKRLISVFIITAMLFSSTFGMISAYADELNDTESDIEDTEDNIQTEATDVSALIQKLNEIEAIEDIENKYNVKTVNAWIEKANAAIENQNITKVEIESLIAECNEIIANVALPITSAEEFLTMQPDGNYILMTDITLSENYGEFSGFLNGNGKTVTLEGANGVFSTLNGAVIRNLIIDGNIITEGDVGALTTIAYGEAYFTNVINNSNITVNVADKKVSGFIADVSQNAKIHFDSCVNNGAITGGITAGFLSDVSDGEVYLYFYNCVNSGAISCGENATQNPAAGFVANALDGDTKSIELSYCANLGQINATSSAGAFLAFGKGNIKLHSCLNIGNVFVKFAEPSEQIQPIGGFVGGISDTVYTITVENSIQSGSVTVENNYTNNPIALLIGSADGGVTLKCVVINGKVTSNDTNVYKISSSEKIAIENTVINVQFEKRTIFDDISLPPIIVPHFNSIDKTENTDINGIPSEQQEELNLLSYNAILASATVDIELKIAAFEAYFELFKSALQEIEFYRVKLAIKNYIEEITKTPKIYDLDAYYLYLADINTLLAAIDSAKSYEELEAIDVTALIAEAETKLLTIEEAQSIALAEAKHNALTALSAKKENAGNIYTAKSYAEYCDAFDAIFAQINDATTVEAVKAIDIAALKVAAEIKLVVVIPEPDEDYEDENYNNGFDETDFDLNDEEEDAETLAPVTNTEKNNGCSSSLALSSVAVISSLGLALIIKSKKTKYN